jgi:hypothetical protein
MNEAWLALWNGLSPEIPEAEYECWHGIEHVPERVSREGFIEAHRYRATMDGTPRYFTWYRLRSLAALASPGYRELLDHPTPWSARMRPHLVDFLRWPCEAVARVGTSVGAALATWRLAVDAAPSARPAMGDAALACWLEEAVAQGLLLSAHIGHHRPDASFSLSGVPTADGSATAGGERLVLLQHGTPAALDAALVALDATRPAGVRPLAAAGRYQWLMATRADALPTPAGVRPAPRLDLMRGFAATD